MRSGLAAAALLVLAFVAGRFSAGESMPAVQAQSAQAPRVWSVPKSWGTFKAVYYDQLLFEDEAGTIRSVYPNSTSVVYMIRRR